MNQRSQFTGTSDWLLHAAKQNPEGLLLLAAGAVLLMRKNGLSGLSVNRGHSPHEDHTASASAAAPNTLQRTFIGLSSLVFHLSPLTGGLSR